MHLSLSKHLFLLSAYSSLALAQGSAGADPYIPVYTQCPRDLEIRAAKDGLSDEESAWRELRAKQMMSNLEDYLKLAKINDFDINKYMDKLKEDDVPIVGLSVSGGGTQSGLGGLGVWKAFDSRSDAAIAARTGGLAQLLSYITGLSGGGAVTVGLLAANNFTTTDNIQKATNFSTSYAEGPDGNQTEFLNTIFENTGAKLEAGFPVSVGDTFGQFWGTWLPEDQLFSNYSDIASNGTAFAMGDAPMPIMCFAEVIPGKSPEIGKLMYPTRNTSNLFNLTAYEVTPYEFGSWAGGRVQAFIPTKYLGTSMSDGKPQNRSECVEGFDKLTLMQGTTTNAFTAWFIDSFYGVPIFAKRWLDKRQQVNPDINDVPIPDDEYDNPLVELANQTASYFDLTFNQSLWSTYPNPFEGYNEDMKDVSELLLIDGSLTLDTNPLRPLIIPERKLDLIIVYEASSDAPNGWVNGTNLRHTAIAASQGNIPFPEIPDLDIAFDNAFQVATYGNGSVDENWPACLACAAIKGSLRRVDIGLPKQCDECFNKHCWNGTTSSRKATAADFDLKLRLDSGLTFEKWNESDWSSESRTGGSGDGKEDDSAGVKIGNNVISLVLSVAAMVYML
ncbi:hypothetical protein FSST1_008907 [Fusarium sambucinum]